MGRAKAPNATQDSIKLQLQRMDEVRVGIDKEIDDLDERKRPLDHPCVWRWMIVYIWGVQPLPTRFKAGPQAL